MNRAPVNGPVDDPTCNYNTGRDKPGESVSSSPGQTSAETAETTAGWLVPGQQDYARFAAWAGALSQGSFASLAGDWALQRCSIKQARQRESPPASRRRWKSVRMVSSSGGRATTYRYTLPFAPLIFSRFIFFSLTKEPSVL